jgi:transcriptional regulator of NAD metabolism
MEVRMLQITVTLSANQEDVIEEVRRLEREGIAKIHEHTPTLILNVPDQRNEEKVIAALAKLARKGLVTEFRSSWVK